MKCLYCGATEDEMYVIREAVKPPHRPHRWKRIGHCCERCYGAGKVTTTDKFKKESR